MNTSPKTSHVKVSTKPARKSVGFEPFAYLCLTLLVIMTLFPIYYICANSFKTLPEYFRSNLRLPTQLEWSNYSLAWEALRLPLFNTVVIVLVSVLGIVVLAACSAYAFALIKFPGRNVLYLLVFSLLLIPGFLTLIPVYLQIKKMGLAGGHLSLILPYIAGGQAFTIFVLKSFFETLPKELFEAAKVDGANDIQMFGRVVLPLSVPVLASVALINLIPLWNDLLLPQLVLTDKMKTVTLALLRFTGAPMGGDMTNETVILAGYVLASIPLVFLMSFLMRYYIEGLTNGSIKG